MCRVSDAPCKRGKNPGASEKRQQTTGKERFRGQEFVSLIGEWDGWEAGESKIKLKRTGEKEKSGIWKRLGEVAALNPEKRRRPIGV